MFGWFAGVAAEASIFSEEEAVFFICVLDGFGNAVFDVSCIPVEMDDGGFVCVLCGAVPGL